MKNLFVAILLFLIHLSFSQDIPTDSSIQSILKEHCKTNDIDVYCSNMYDDRKIDFIFPILFKDTATLGKQKYLIVISSIENGSMHGHTFGCKNYFFLRNNASTWSVKNQIIETEPQPILDQVEYDIIKIGKEKVALKSVFQSTGNQHYERNMSLSELNSCGLKHIFYLTLEYNNLAWKLPPTSENECNASKIIKTFNIIPSDKEWYDINIIIEKYTYDKGCESEILQSQKKEIYSFTKGKYIKK